MGKEIRKFDYHSICGQSEMINGFNNGMSQSWWKIESPMIRDEISTEKDNIRNETQVEFIYLPDPWKKFERQAGIN